MWWAREAGKGVARLIHMVVGVVSSIAERHALPFSCALADVTDRPVAPPRARVRRPRRPGADPAAPPHVPNPTRPPVEVPHTIPTTSEPVGHSVGPGVHVGRDHRI